MSIDESLEMLTRFKNEYDATSLNEAETRFHIIDKVLQKTFFWPSSNIRMEQKTNEGYTDYQLMNKEKTYLVIEAKRENINFHFNQYKEISNNKIKVKVLMKDENTNKTILQVKNYCNDIGCNFACITNGHEWAFFRTYIDGKSWQDGNAYIIHSLQHFIDNFSEIHSYLTYNKIVNEYSLSKLFDGVEHSSNERYEPKLKINGYSEQISNNHIENQIRGYFDRYFGEIRNIDEELLAECYVSERGYTLNFDKVTNLLEDALSPYMLEETKLKDIEIKSDDKNTFSDEILRIVIKEKKSKVLVLFGGKGAGKTTFLVNLFNNKRNSDLKHHTIIGYVNLLKVANDKEAIKNAIHNQLIEKLDNDKLLSGSNEDLVNLFKDKFDIELQQSLDGLDRNGDSFKLKRNEILKEYKKDSIYSLSRLAHYWRSKKKAIIINIDNTDQFDQNLQDYCFSLANDLSEKLHCISIISLREERYISSSIRGYLDAYEQNGFHISSPKPQQVFLKRLKFIQDKINNENKVSEKNKHDINILFNILKINLENEKSEFNKFMTAATHGNIRQGLELFKYYLFSHYTNVSEMIKQESWIITLPQVIKPIMIPIYRFYNEKVSNTIPNIFKLRSEYNSSHFTAYRILSKLSNRNNDYVSIHELKSYFIENFNMENDFVLNIDLLLNRGFIESENGFDKYDENLQKIKITSFGYYMQEVIFKDFAYLELVSVDLAVLDKQISNEIINYSNEDYALLKKGQKRHTSEDEANNIRYQRVIARINKVEKFCEYLHKQEKSEIEYYSPNFNNLITDKIIENFHKQKPYIEKSAKYNLNINTERNETKNGIRNLD